MRAVIYSRVSDAKQRDRHTIASQLSTLPRFVEERGWKLAAPADTYVDDGRTAKAGHLEKREAFQRLMRDAPRKTFDVVVVIDQDRLTRSEDLRERGEVLGAFQRAGVQIAIASTGQVLDLGSSMGDLLSNLGAFFAAEENRKRRERTVRGRQEAARQGRPSAPVPWGLKFDQATKVWSIDKPVAKIVREFYERVASGESTPNIAADMQRRGVKRKRSTKWHGERVYAIVKSAAYRGEWMADRQRRIVIKVPPIVSADRWYSAQEALAANGRRGLRRTRYVYLLEDIAACSLCGARIYIHNTAPYRYYYCGRRRRGRFGESCTLPLRRVDEVDGRVWTAISELLLRPDHLERALERSSADAARDEQNWSGDLATYERKLARIEHMEETVLKRFRRDLLSEKVFDSELERIAAERRMLRRQIEMAQQQAQSARKQRTGSTSVLARAKELRSRLESASPEERRDFVRALVPLGSRHRVVLGAKKIHVHVAVAALSSMGDESGLDYSAQTSAKAINLRVVA